MDDEQPRETELKFLVDPARAEALFASLAPGAGPARKLTSVYYDTRRRDLRKAGLTLRVRQDGARYVQTVKTPQGADGGLGRGEWEREVPGERPDAAAAASTPAAKLVKRTDALEAVFTVTVDRRQVDLPQDGAIIELSLDQGEVAAGARRAPISELELELKAGDPATLLAGAARLRKALGLPLSFLTKADRGFDLADGRRSRARPFVGPKLTAAMSAGAAFRAIARACLEQIAGNAERLREAPAAEVIHQMRVGARRLRSALSTFKDVVADRRVAGIKAELKWLTGELDTARNLDVLLSGAYRRAARRKDDTAGLKDLGRRLRLQRAAAYARARTAAGSDRFATLVMDTLVWVEAGPWTQDGAKRERRRERPIGEFAAEALEARRRKLVKRGRRLAKLDREARHKLRIEAKKLRYAAESFAGLWGRERKAKAFIKALKALQDDLGALNDIATGESLARDLVAAPSDAGEAHGAAGRLIGAEAAREGALVAAAAAEFKDLAAAKRFWPAI